MVLEKDRRGVDPVGLEIRLGETIRILHEEIGINLVSVEIKF